MESNSGMPDEFAITSGAPETRIVCPTCLRARLARLALYMGEIHQKYSVSSEQFVSLAGVQTPTLDSN